jgi:hypothetical protein
VFTDIFIYQLFHKRIHRWRGGHAHEDFCHVALDQMWGSKDLKIEEMWWEFSITRDGKKRYTVYKNRATTRRSSSRWTECST